MKKLLCNIIVIALTLAGCTKSEITPASVENIPSDEDLQREFAMILSKAIHQNKPLRALIKKESLEAFDCTTDVLYREIRDEKIDGEITVRKMMEEYASCDLLDSIEERFPLLTIYVPDWTNITGFCAEDWDVSSPEVAISYALENKTHTLWYNGEISEELEMGEYPPFPVLIVKENDRVRLRSSATKGSPLAYEYVDPVFDPSIKGLRTKGIEFIDVVDSEVESLEEDNFLSGPELSALHNQILPAFNSVSGNVVQRDFLYYAMSLDSEEKPFIHGTSEWLYKIRFKSALPAGLYDDQSSQSGYSNDPSLPGEYTEWNNDNRLSPDVLRQKFWVNGNIELSFNVFKMDKSGAVSYVSKVRTIPYMDLFYLARTHVKLRHKCIGNPKRDFRYYVEPSCYEPKWYVMNEELIYDWNIGTECANLLIRVSEVDSGATVARTLSYEGVFATNFREYAEIGLSGSVTLEDLVNISGNFKVGGEYGSTSTKKHTTSLVITETQNSDLMGEDILYYNKPIVLGVRNNNGMNEYEVATLSTGQLELMVLPRKI